jgi:hypothetical protein
MADEALDPDWESAAANFYECETARAGISKKTGKTIRKPARLGFDQSFRDP